ncbi:hypothetical protein BDC45DRAFT_113149 [Circinella umbellata]|nr:hypothetical protein BDC45DRAFT_113149 [Circinella umbellata]
MAWIKNAKKQTKGKEVRIDHTILYPFFFFYMFGFSIITRPVMILDELLSFIGFIFLWLLIFKNVG